MGNCMYITNDIFKRIGFPQKKGLYDPNNEHDACGFGFIANIKNEPRHELVHQALGLKHHHTNHQ